MFPVIILTETLPTSTRALLFALLCSVYNSEEEFEDTKGGIRIRIPKRTYNTIGIEKGQKDKQRSLKHTYKTKDRVTRTALKTKGKLRFSGRVNYTPTYT